MTRNDVIRELRPDLFGVDERSDRSKRVRQDLRDRAEVARAQLASLAADTGGELSERTVAAREALLERLREIERGLPTEEVAAKAQRGAWRAFQAGLTGLLTLPALAVRGLGALSEVADDLAERGADVSERGRELLATVPPSQAARRRSRKRTVVLGGLGFLAGLVTGWMLSGRRQTMVTYEPTLPPDWEAPTRPVTPPGVTSEATPGSGEAAAGLLDVRSETDPADAERPADPERPTGTERPADAEPDE